MSHAHDYLPFPHPQPHKEIQIQLYQTLFCKFFVCFLPLPSLGLPIVFWFLLQFLQLEVEQVMFLTSLFIQCPKLCSKLLQPRRAFLLN